MPNIVNFNNRQVVEPGSYSRVIGGVEQSPASASTGTVLIIDNGLGAGFGGGSGVNGQNESGLNSVYEFSDLKTFRTWMRGGIMWDLAFYLFNPAPAQMGVNKLLFVSAKTSTQSDLTLNFGAGIMTMKTVAEGIGANGVLNSDSELSTGFAVKFLVGSNDDSKFRMQFWKGSFKGNDVNGSPFGDISSLNSSATLITESVEVSNMVELKEWMDNDYNLSLHFSDFTSAPASGDGVFVAGDVTLFADYQLFVNGTETYSSTDLDDVLDVIGEVDYTFILSDKHGVVDGKGAENVKIWSHIQHEAVYDKFLIVGGGEDSTQFDQIGAGSIDLAGFYDSAMVHVIHGGVKRTKVGGGFNTYSSLYSAAMYVGRIAGLEPQVPCTWKNLYIDGVTHELSLKQREKALKAGVLHFKKVQGRFVVNQDVNTLQNNGQMIFPDGTSPEGSVMRIASLLNKELKINTEQQFVGTNANTSSPADVKAFVEGYLTLRTASRTQDNLIIKFANVEVTLNNTDYEVNYAFMPNGPVNRLFITGTMLDVNLNA